MGLEPKDIEAVVMNGAGKRVFSAHAIATVIALVANFIVFAIFWIDTMCETFYEDFNAVSGGTGAGIRFGTGLVLATMLNAVVGVVGSLLGSKSSGQSTPGRVIPGVASLLVPHALSMVILVVLSRASVTDRLSQLTDLSMFNVFNVCDNAYRFTLVTVPLFLLPVVLMLFIAYRFGKGKAAIFDE